MKWQRLAFGFWMVLLLAVLLPATYQMATLVWLRQPGQPAMDLLLEGEVLSAEGFDRIRSSRQAALDFKPNAQDAIELGLAQTFESLMRDDLSEYRRQELRAQAILNLNAGLAMTPISYNGWYALTLAHFTLDETEASTRAFAGTMLLTPYAAHNLSSRLQLGMSLWANLSLEVQDQLKREIVFAARFDTFTLVRLAMQTDLERQVRALVATTEDGSKLLERFTQAQLRLIREATRNVVDQ